MDFSNNNMMQKPGLTESNKNVFFFASLITAGVVIWLVAYKTGLVAWLFAAVGL